MNYPRSIAFAVLWLMLSQTPSVAQDFEKGLAAARAGNFAVAVAEWRPLANDGHVEAQFNLGAIYEAGFGVPKDAAEAAGWYALAAGQVHARAQYNLGVMYADGRGVPRDDSRAATWFRKAAEQNHGKAQYNLGIFYQAGRGLPKDPVLAQVWFNRAAANGVDPTRASASGSSVDSELLSPVANKRSADANSVGLHVDKDDLVDSEVPTVVAVPELEPDRQPESEAAAGFAIASLSEGRLRIAANFPDGARYRLEIVETRERARDGGIVMTQTSKMGVDMVVKSGPDDGILIEWTFSPATVETAGDPKAGRLASELGKLIDGQKIEYHVNQSGKVTELGNPTQLTSFYEKSIDRVLSGIDAQTADPQLVDDIRANMAPLLSQDYAATRALELPKLLHFFSGLELATGKIYSRAGVMNLPPSADALPSRLDYELKWFDRAAGVAWLSWRQSVDPEQAASAMKAYIETLAAQSGQPSPKNFDIGTIDVSDSADYEIDLATGFPKQVIYIRKIELFGFSQTEKRRIRVLQ